MFPIAIGQGGCGSGRVDWRINIDPGLASSVVRFDGHRFRTVESMGSEKDEVGGVAWFPSDAFGDEILGPYMMP